MILYDKIKVNYIQLRKIFRRITRRKIQEIIGCKNSHCERQFAGKDICQYRSHGGKEFDKEIVSLELPQHHRPLFLVDRKNSVFLIHSLDALN